MMTARPLLPRPGTDMKPHRPLLTLLAASLLAGTVSGAAYIKFDGVDGESQATGHKDWIIIQSLTAGLRRPAADGAGMTNVPLADIVVVKSLDKSSPKLAEAVATGHVFPSVTFHLTRNLGPDQEATYYTYELKNVLVTSYQVGGGGGSSEARPMESFSLNFEEIKVTYVPSFDVNGRPVDPVDATVRVKADPAGGTN
jgi:type VI secretion system secreted protein Hcp